VGLNSQVLLASPRALANENNPLSYLLFFCACSSRPASPKPIAALDSMTVKSAAYIGLVKMQTPVDDLIECTIIDSLKGGKSLDDHFLLRVGDDHLDFLEGDICLVRAEEHDGLKYYVDKDSRILREEDSEKDIAYLRSMLACFDP
jgi:hypothetical protein